MDLLTTVKLDFLINDLTKELDKCIKIGNFKNYIYSEIMDNKYYLLRCAGGTRGSIEVDSNSIIKEIKLYKDSINIYDKEKAEEIIKKYINMKIVII